MRTRLRDRVPGHTTVVAYIALMLAVIGVPTAWALSKNSVGSAQIKKAAVRNSDIAPQSRYITEGCRRLAAERGLRRRAASGWASG